MMDFCLMLKELVSMAYPLYVYNELINCDVIPLIYEDDDDKNKKIDHYAESEVCYMKDINYLNCE